MKPRLFWCDAPDVTDLSQRVALKKAVSTRCWGVIVLQKKAVDYPLVEYIFVDARLPKFESINTSSANHCSHRDSLRPWDFH